MRKSGLTAVQLVLMGKGPYRALRPVPAPASTLGDHMYGGKGSGKKRRGRRRADEQ
jgi:hypothetical protein